MTAQTTLRPGEFRAQCQKGHELETFTDRAAFEAHMTGEHKAKRIAPGSMGPHLFTNRTAPGWTGGKIAAPYPHEAPKPARGGLEKLARDLEAGKYDVSLYPAWRQIAPERMGQMIRCELDGTNHSDDVVTVFRGHPEPQTMCGFHASQIA